MFNQKGFLKNIVIIVILVVLVFVSQQSAFRSYGKDLYGYIGPKIEEYKTKVVDWFKTTIYPRVSGEVEQKGNAIGEEINKQKNNFVQNIWENAKKYFADIFTKVSGTKVQ